MTPSNSPEHSNRSADRYLTLDDVDVGGLQVLVRSDLNVPMVDGHVADDFRLLAALPTLERLVDEGAAVSVCSHLGRPDGHDPSLSLSAVAERMNEISNLDVHFEAPGDVTVLENTRFDNGETSNDPESASRLVTGFDLFVQDAFGSVHRSHASTVGAATLIRSVAGPLLDAELTALGALVEQPDRPFSVVLGGAKVSDKLAVIENLLPKVDQMMIGGGMCFTFLKAKGCDVGGSLVEDSMIEAVAGLLDDERIVLPSDIVVGDEFSSGSAHRVVDVDSIPEGWMGLDIGPETSAEFARRIAESSSVFWNGPMGVFEWDAYSAGTRAVAEALSANTGFTVVGGGDSVAALRSFGLTSNVSHLSTGGGAGLELLEGNELPGVAVLERWVQ